MTIRQDKSEYHAVQVGATDKPFKTTTRQMQGHFRKANVSPKRIVKEFPITPDAHVPIGMRLIFVSFFRFSLCYYGVGTTFSAIHFVPGQYVDVIAKSYVFARRVYTSRSYYKLFQPWQGLSRRDEALELQRSES